MADTAPTPSGVLGNPSVGRNAVLTFSPQVVSVLVAVVCMPFILKALGVPRLGLLTMVWAILGYFSVLDLGMGVAVTRAASIALGSGRIQAVRRIFWSGVGVQVAMGALGGAVLALSSGLIGARLLHLPPALNQEAKYSFILCGIALPVLLINSSVIGLLQAFQLFKPIAIVQIPASIAQFLLPVAIGRFSPNLTPIVGALLALRIASLIVFVVFVRQAQPKVMIPVLPSPSEALSLLRFGGWATLGALVSPLMVYADRFLVGSVVSLSAVAYYSVPLDSNMRLLVLASSLATALFPALSYNLGATNAARVNELVVKATKYTLVLIGFPTVFLIFCAAPLLTWWLGAEFASRAAQLMAILLVGIMANALARAPFVLLQAAGRADVTSLLQIIESPLQLALCYVLLIKVGVAGAAIAWTLRLVVETVLLFLLAGNFTGLSFGVDDKRWVLRFAGLLVCVAGLTLAFVTCVRSPYGKVFISAALMLAGGIGASIVFFTEEERRTVARALLPALARCDRRRGTIHQ